MSDHPSRTVGEQPARLSRIAERILFPALVIAVVVAVKGTGTSAFHLAATLIGGSALLRSLVLFARPADSVVVTPRRPRHQILTERWERARERRGEILREYGAWELDPEMLLRFPALWDLDAAPVQAFHDALERTSQLETAEIPGGRKSPDEQRIAEFERAVRDLARTWYSAERHARRIGLDDLTEPLRRNAETALKLYRHSAGTEHRPESATYARRASEAVRELVERGVLPDFLPAIAELDRRAHPAIESSSRPGGYRPGSASPVVE